MFILKLKSTLFHIKIISIIFVPVFVIFEGKEKSYVKGS